MSKNKLALIGTLSAAAILAGCSTSPKFECGAPEGIGCVDMGTVHTMIKDETLPTLNKTVFTGSSNSGSSMKISYSEESEYGKPRKGAAALNTVQAGAPLFVPPEIIRGKMRSFTDETGDLHGERFLFIKLHDGYWAVGKEGK